MAKITPFQTTTKHTLDNRVTRKLPRPYLGMSQIGHSCERYLWYYFHWAFQEEISNEIQRLFNRGNLEEDQMIAELESIGCEITGQQTALVGAHGHARGHTDGQILGLVEAPMMPHLAEFKTHNEKSFADLTKKGVKTSKPVHYAQMQRYMHELSLEAAFYCALNKNNSAIYCEIVKYDMAAAQLLCAKEEKIIEVEVPPKRIGGAEWFECKWCDAYDVCHFGEAPERNCRTCLYHVIEDAGEWSCAEKKCKLTVDEQIKGCDTYVLDKSFN